MIDFLHAWPRYRSKIAVWWIVLGLLAALALPASGAAPEKKPGRLVAVVDYHQHLVSPAGAELRNRLNFPVPAVELPLDLVRLLRERAERWNDKTALADLYTEDSLTIDPYSSDWVRGRAAVAAHLSDLFARPFRLTPLAFASAGSSGHIAGYFTRGDGPSLSSTLSDDSPPPRNLTPTLSHRPPFPRERAPPPTLRAAVSLLSRRKGGRWERRVGEVRFWGAGSAAV